MLALPLVEDELQGYGFRGDGVGHEWQGRRHPPWGSRYGVHTSKSTASTSNPCIHGGEVNRFAAESEGSHQLLARTVHSHHILIAATTTRQRHTTASHLRQRRWRRPPAHRRIMALSSYHWSSSSALEAEARPFPIVVTG
uniref:Uncharacterized protein n=1 Tax=Arundo donax TaxID=35708 RepID=A0A0A9EZQ2_ARUDO